MASKWKDGPGAAREIDAALARLDRAYRTGALDRTGAQDQTAARIANTAIALMRLGRPDAVWLFLRQVPDPRIRGYLIDRMGPLRMRPRRSWSTGLRRESGCARCGQPCLLAARGGAAIDSRRCGDRKSRRKSWRSTRRIPTRRCMRRRRWLLRHVGYDRPRRPAQAVSEAGDRAGQGGTPVVPHPRSADDGRATGAGRSIPDGLAG